MFQGDFGGVGETVTTPKLAKDLCIKNRLRIETKIRSFPYSASQVITWTNKHTIFKLVTLNDSGNCSQKTLFAKKLKEVLENEKL